MSGNLAAHVNGTVIAALASHVDEFGGLDAVTAPALVSRLEDAG